MKIKYYDRDRHEYTILKEVNSSPFSFCGADEIVECCNCGEKHKLGDMNVSERWYPIETYFGSFYGMPECDECYLDYLKELEK